MPPVRKILILSLKRPRPGKRRRKTTGDTVTPRYLAWLVVVLRFLGFKLVTVSQALAAPFGRFACLTFDGLTHDLVDVVDGALPVLQARQVPATVFVSTRANGALKTLPTLTMAGWEIGSLGHDLVDLTSLGYLEQRRLIARSKSLLSAHLGVQPTAFAYPFGAYDATTVSCVKDEGFQAALTLRGGVNDAAVEAHHLRRLPLAGSLPADVLKIVRALVSARRQAKAGIKSSLDRVQDQSGARQGVAL